MENPSSTEFVVKVDHLRRTTTKEYIQRTFSSFGEIKSVRLEPSKQAGENCAFVSYPLLEAANKAVEGMHQQVLNGIRLHVELQQEFSMHSLKTAPNLAPVEEQEVSQFHPVRTEGCSSLKVSNISKATSEPSIVSTFARFPSLHSVKLIRVPDQPCNYAWVNYTDVSSAEMAQNELDQLHLDGNVLAVTLRDSKSTHRLPGSLTQEHCSNLDESSSRRSEISSSASDCSVSSQLALTRPTRVTTSSIFPKREPGIPICISGKSSSLSELVTKGTVSIQPTLEMTASLEASKHPPVPQPSTAPPASFIQRVGTVTSAGCIQPQQPPIGWQSTNATSEVKLTFSLDKLSESVTKKDGMQPQCEKLPVDTAATDVPASSSPPSAKGQRRRGVQKLTSAMSAAAPRQLNLQKPVSEAVPFHVSRTVAPNVYSKGLRSVCSNANRGAGGSQSAHSMSTLPTGFSFRLPSPPSLGFSEANRATLIPLRKHSLELPETRADDAPKKPKLQQSQLHGSELTVDHTVLPTSGAPSQSLASVATTVTSNSAVNSTATVAMSSGLLLKQQGLDLGSSGGKHSISLHPPANRGHTTSNEYKKGATKYAAPKPKLKLDDMRSRPVFPSLKQPTAHPHKKQSHVPDCIRGTTTSDVQGASAAISPRVSLSTKPHPRSEQPVKSLHGKQSQGPTVPTASKNPFLQALPLQSTHSGDKAARETSRLGAGMTNRSPAKTKPMERPNSVTVSVPLPNVLVKQVLLSSTTPFGSRLQEISRRHDVVVNQGQEDAEGSTQLSLSGVPSHVQGAAKELRQLASEVQSMVTVRPMQLSHAAVPTLITDKFQDTVKAIEESNSVQVSVAMRDLTSNSIRIGEFATEATALQTKLMDDDDLLEVAHLFPRFIATKPTFEWHALNEQQQSQPVQPSINLQLNSLYSPSGEVTFQFDSFQYTADFGALVLEEKSDFGDQKHYQLQPALPVWSYYRDDDFGFVPHEPKVSKAIEDMLWYGGQTVEMEGSALVIDFESMLQINLCTQTPVCLQREPPLPFLPHRIELQVTGLQESISEAIVKLQSAIEESQISHRYTLPPNIRLSSVAPVRLYNESRRFCVESSLEECDNEQQLLLKGERQYVGHVKLKMMALALEIQQERLHTHPLDTPAEWSPQLQPRELKQVSERDREWTWINDCMKESIPSVQLIAVERNQDIQLWERYSFSKKCMLIKKGKKLNEKFLFHGTSSTEPKKICAEGFDFRLSRDGLWGRGAYFAEKAGYSDSDYAHQTSDGNKQLLLARVLIGDSTELPHDRKLTRPPIKSSGMSSNGSTGEDHYDSVTGLARNSRIYIVYEHYKAYPAYLITYRTD